MKILEERKILEARKISEERKILGERKEPGRKKDGSKAAEKVSPGAPSLLSAYPDPVAQASWSGEEGGGGW